MRAKKVLAGLAVAALATGVAVSAGFARADDEGGGAPAGGAPPPVQKVIKHPYVDSLLGTWSTESTGPMGNSKGSTTYRLGVGDTVLLQDYQSVGPGPGGGEMKFFGHGVFKVSDDGKTITVWWIDTHSPEPIKLSGALTDKGYDISGDTPQGKLHLTLSKTPEGHLFTMDMGGMTMTDVYKPAPK